MNLKIPKYRQKMLAIILFLLFVPLMVNAYLTNKARVNLKIEIYERMRTINYFTRERVNAFVEDKVDKLEIIGRDVIFYHLHDKENLDNYLKDFKKISILTTGGKVLISTDEKDIGTDKSQADYYKNFKKQLYIASNEKVEASFFVTVPLSDNKKKIEYIIVGEVNFAALEMYFKSNIPETYVGFYLVDKCGNLIFSFSDEKHIPSFIDIEEIEKQTEKREEGAYINFNKNEVIGIYKEVNKLGWVLISEIYTTRALVNSDELIYKNRWINLAVILIVLIIGFIASRQIDVPLKELNSSVKEITGGNLKRRTNIKTGDELEDLGKMFNSMVEHLEELYNDLEEKVSERTEELEEANRQLHQMSKLKSEFLANMSHELRTPLNSIIGFSELMADKVVGDLNEDQEQCVSDILESGKHLLQLINNILDLSKVEAGKMELHSENFSLEETIGLVTRTMSSLFEKKELKLNSEIDKNLPYVYGDNGKFKQIMINLLSNAIKFTSRGGTITVRAEKKEKDFVISVKDTGVGIKEEDLKYIFEEFRQVDGSHTREQEGTGLGLALTRKFVELHKGKIWAESKVGEGTIFYFTIPDING